MSDRSPRRSISPQRNEENPGTNLFVTGLAPKIKEQDLSDLFSKYGHVFYINTRLKKSTS